MANFRSCSQFDFKNPNFIAVVIAQAVVFFIYVYQFIYRDGQYMIVPWLILTSFFFLMAIWSYIAVVVTQPGTVPLYWGIYQDIHKQRKYCLVCHNFKPERSHHCSKCKKCILNMDHHCPWINNCVGFYNRKYFLLFIFYLLIAILLAAVQMGILIYTEFKQIFNNQGSFNIHTAIRIIQLIFCLLMFVSVFIFFLTHMRMVFQNITTIQQMLVQRKKRIEIKKPNTKSQDLYINEFNINKWYNFTQVFGINPFYWLIPVQQQQKLRGRGLYWEKNSDQQRLKDLKQKEEIEMLKFQQKNNQVSILN